MSSLIVQRQRGEMYHPGAPKSGTLIRAAESEQGGPYDPRMRDSLQTPKLDKATNRKVMKGDYL